MDDSEKRGPKVIGRAGSHQFSGAAARKKKVPVQMPLPKAAPKKAAPVRVVNMNLRRDTFEILNAWAVSRGLTPSAAVQALLERTGIAKRSGDEPDARRPDLTEEDAREALLEPAEVVEAEVVEVGEHKEHFTEGRHFPWPAAKADPEPEPAP